MPEMTVWDWLARLGPRLVARQFQVRRWENYYAGYQDLPSGPQQNVDAYRRFQSRARTNLCRLCVDSMVHRMQVIGYRDGSDEGGNDASVWDLWQRARMDSRQFALWRRALRASRAFAIVGAHPNRPNEPRVTIEDASTVIIETDPADAAETLAAMRLFYDGISRRWMATVWLPGVRFSFQSRAQFPDDYPGTIDGLGWNEAAWEPREQPQRLSGDEIPVYEFANADEGDPPSAEFEPGMDVQDRLNLTLLNRLTAERYSAFRQRYITNYEPEVDEATGLPVAPFNPGADQTLTLPPPEPGQPEPRLGDLAQTATSDMLRGVDADMRAFAAVTITPVYYMPGDMVNVSADAVAALDAGHNAKIRQRQTAWGEQLERVLQRMANIAGLDRDLSASELVWARPENLNITAVAAYAQTLRNAGYPLPIVAERIGETPQQIDRLRSEMAADTFRSQLMNPPGEPEQPTPTNAPGQPSTGPVAAEDEPA